MLRPQDRSGSLLTSSSTCVEDKLLKPLALSLFWSLGISLLGDV